MNTSERLIASTDWLPLAGEKAYGKTWMRKTASLIVIALLTALAIEALNFWLLAPPIDVGYPPGTPWFIHLVGFQWVILHLPGLLLLDRLERMFGCQQLNIVMGCRAVDVSVLFVSGYLDTLLALIAVIFGFRWIPHVARRYSAGRKRPRQAKTPQPGHNAP